MSEPKLPTQEEIAKLPRWARVAFAARCARRALPLFKQHWPAAPDDHLQAVERAVSVAEAPAVRSDVNAATNTAALAGIAAKDCGALAAYYSAYAAAYGTYALIAGGNFGADRAASRAANRSAAAGVPIALLSRDFQNLLDAATRGKWDDTTPVPPSVFGPLDELEPTPVVVEAPAEAEPPKKFKIVIEAYATTQTDPDETGRQLVQLYHHLDEYCRLKYGHGITLKEFEQRIKIGAMVPAGGGQ